MDDLVFGRRSKRGDWKPNEPVGTWHDGSMEGEARMEECFRKKRECMNAKSHAA
jgi:hypothetical protein